MIEENVVDQEWVNSNQHTIASWSAFHLIWSINHDLALSSANLYPVARKYGVTGIEQENVLLDLEAKCQHIQNSYKLLSTQYVKYNFARLAHENITEQGTAFIAAMKAIKRLYASLQNNAPEIAKIGDEFLRGKYGFVNEDQRSTLVMAFNFNKALVTIHSCISTWLSAKRLNNINESKQF